MGQQQSKAGKPWVEIAVNTIPQAVDAYTSYKNGKVMREEMRETGPKIRACASAIVDSINDAKIDRGWNRFLSGLGAAVHFLEVWQGASAHTALEDIGARLANEAEAHTGLIAPKKFVEQVHDFIIEKTSREWPSRSRNHVFFLYHPDTDWSPSFFRRIQNHPLSQRFLGMSENLDALVLWMRFIKEKMAKEGKKIHIHLLIPAYRPMLIGASLAVPDQLLPMSIHGHIHNSKPYVWLNIPHPARRLSFYEVGNLADLPRQ